MLLREGHQLLSRPEALATPPHRWRQDALLLVSQDGAWRDPQQGREFATRQEIVGAVGEGAHLLHFVSHKEERVGGRFKRPR